jgi:succinate dehydrogenase / fumarate reductase cytochrome b subunit
MSEAKANTAVTKPRPLSPHLVGGPHVFFWRWHLTMWTSIIHRATGVALYFAAFVGAAWAVSLASGADAYARFLGVMGSPIGKLVLFGLTFSAFYHLANGIRHLAWDSGKGFEPKVADTTGAAVLAFGAAATIAVWLIAAMTGAL